MPTNEVIRLTIAAENGDATQEEWALLCRQIEDDSRAVDVYIRTIQDTLSLRNICGVARVGNDTTTCGDLCGRSPE